MCRRKGRVVLVGDVSLNLKRADFYAKEIDFFISCSYGPGRYDGAYEERGVKQDSKEAVKWFIKAARQGNKTAQHNLGLHYAAVEAGQAD